MERRTFLGIIGTLAISSKVFAAEKTPTDSSSTATPVPSFIDKSKCIHCGTCFKNCPVKAISKQVIDEVDAYTVDPKKCIFCGTCIKNCPVKAVNWVSTVAVKASTDSVKTQSKGKIKK
jgi:ferredoxin